MSDSDFYSRIDQDDLYRIAVAVRDRAVHKPRVEACLDAVLGVLKDLRSTPEMSKARFMARLTDHACDEMFGVRAEKILGEGSYGT